MSEPLDESQYPPDLRLPDRESTMDVVLGIQRRDPAADRAFVDRFLPILRRRAHHRLSQRARRVCDTEDIVQSALYDFLKYLAIELIHPPRPYPERDHDPQDAPLVARPPP